MQLCSACLCAPSNVQLCIEKCEHLPPPPPKTHTFLKRPFLIDFKKYTHTPPPPYMVTCLHIGAKIVNNPKKWQKRTKLAAFERGREKYAEILQILCHGA